VRRALTWLAGAVGLAALARLRSRRRAVAVERLREQDPAEELRRKLADRRTGEPSDGDPESGVQSVEAQSISVQPIADEADDPLPAEAQPVDLEARRTDVHARAQEAIDLMRDGETEPESPNDRSVQ
jgi:hypothetical protein